MIPRLSVASPPPTSLNITLSSSTHISGIITCFYARPALAMHDTVLVRNENDVLDADFLIERLSDVLNMSVAPWNTKKLMELAHASSTGLTRPSLSHTHIYHAFKRLFQNCQAKIRRCTSITTYVPPTPRPE